MLELVREIVEQDLPHAGLEVIFTPCEEIGLLGAKHFDVSQLAARFGYVFDHGNDIGLIVTRAPTQISLTMTFIGRAAHSGIAPEEGKSSILAAAQALSNMQLGRLSPESTANVASDPYLKLSMICCAFLMADSSGALSLFRISIAFCAEAIASFLLPSLA